MISVEPLALEGVFEITPICHADERGFFSETYSQPELKKHGIDLTFIQDNHSLSKQSGVLRGLHFQVAPYAQDKLVRVVRGSIYDVAVDLRVNSKTFKKWVGVEISAEKKNQLLVPTGYAHGFLTLEPNTEVIYKVTAPYAPQQDRAVLFNDPEIGIDWPGDPSTFILSKRDEVAPFLNDIQNTIDFGS